MGKKSQNTATQPASSVPELLPNVHDEVNRVQLFVLNHLGDILPGVKVPHVAIGDELDLLSLLRTGHRGSLEVKGVGPLTSGLHNIAERKRKKGC